MWLFGAFLGNLVISFYQTLLFFIKKTQPKSSNRQIKGWVLPPYFKHWKFSLRPSKLLHLLEGLKKVVLYVLVNAKYKAATAL